MSCFLLSFLEFNFKHIFLILLTNIFLDEGIPLLIPKLKSYWNFKIPPCRALLRGLRQISLVCTHVFPLSYSYYYYYYYMRCGIHSYLLLCVSRAVAKRKTIFQPFCVFWGHLQTQRQRRERDGNGDWSCLALVFNGPS